MSADVAVVVLAKRPVPGRVKTRMCPPLRPDQAAEVAAAALTDTCNAVDAADVACRILAFDARTDDWLRPGWHAIEQPDGGLDRRIAAGLAASVDRPALLIGMDTPQVDPEFLTAFDPSAYDACLGRTRDGGYWALGLAAPSRAAEVVLGVAMSRPWTGAEQLARLRAAGMRVQLLPELIDVDTARQACEVAEAGAGPTFTAAVRRHCGRGAA